MPQMLTMIDFPSQIGQSIINAHQYLLMWGYTHLLHCCLLSQVTSSFHAGCMLDLLLQKHVILIKTFAKLFPGQLPVGAGFSWNADWP